MTRLLDYNTSLSDTREISGVGLVTIRSTHDTDLGLDGKGGITTLYSLCNTLVCLSLGCSGGGEIMLELVL